MSAIPYFVAGVLSISDLLGRLVRAAAGFFSLRTRVDGTLVDCRCFSFFYFPLNLVLGDGASRWGAASVTHSYSLVILKIGKAEEAP